MEASRRNRTEGRFQVTTAARIALPFPPGSWFSGLHSLPLACMDAGGVPTPEREGVRYRFSDESTLLVRYDGGWGL